MAMDMSSSSFNKLIDSFKNVSTSTLTGQLFILKPKSILSQSLILEQI